MKKKKKDRWSKTVGEDPYQLNAFERGDRGGDIWTRRWDKSRRHYFDKKFLCESIRAGDKIDAELENKATAKLIERQKALATSDELSTNGKGPLTLARAKQMTLHPKTGKYATDKEWKDEVGRHLDIAVEILGKATLASEIRHLHYQTLWRALARTHRDEGRYGFRAAEMIVGSFRGMIIWLQEQGHIELGTGIPAPKWKAKMREEWVEITDRALPDEPNRPHYTPEESAALWRALPKADPRLQMLLMEGAELRLGQVRRALRSNVFAYKGHEIGGVNIVGRGKKRGEKVLFTETQRAFVVEMMQNGYLSELERAYQAKEIPDYRLVPGEHLVGRKDKTSPDYLATGKAQIKNAMVIPSDRAVRKWWRALEKLAGVAYVKGRGWYGERRHRIQIGEKDKDASATAKNRMSGHTHTQTREIYVGKFDETFREEAAELRARSRPKFGEEK